VAASWAEYTELQHSINVNEADATLVGYAALGTGFATKSRLGS
jgi:hypothetical protein